MYMEHQAIKSRGTLLLDCSREHCTVHFLDLLNILGDFIDVTSYCGDLRRKTFKVREQGNTNTQAV